jgi:hypothetical protein
MKDAFGSTIPPSWEIVDGKSFALAGKTAQACLREAAKLAKDASLVTVAVWFDGPDGEIQYNGWVTVE